MFPIGKKNKLIICFYFSDRRYIPRLGGFIYLTFIEESEMLFGKEQVCELLCTDIKLSVGFNGNCRLAHDKVK